MHKNQLKALVLGLAMVAGQGAAAAGYEKSIMIGGRSAGLAGIATPYAGGAESLYFNPAGLATEKIQGDVNLNVSPLTSQFDQPGFDGDRQYLLPFGLQYGQSIDKDWGFGVGVFTSGGAEAQYTGVDYKTAESLTEKTDLAIAEASAGVGYRVTDRLKLGLAWRVVMARASFQTINAQGPIVVNSGLKSLTDTKFDGFKFGAQYRVADKTFLGLTYRSPIFLDATGKFFGSTNLAGNINESDADAYTVFPEAITLGMQTELADHWQLFAEYAWTNYSRVTSIAIDGDMSSTGAPSLPVSNVEQQWKDQHEVRLAAEYTGWHMPVRFGYAFTSQVTNSMWARGTFAPPGPTHTITLGSQAWFTDNLKLDGAFEYLMGSGSSDNNPGAGSAVLRQGTFDVEEMAVHLALNYVF